MLLDEILYECEIVYTDEEDNILTEAAVRHFKKVGTQIKKQFRCTSGLKKGRIVADRLQCSKRKDPLRKRIGKKVARSKKGIRLIKSRIGRRKQVHNLVTRMNKRLKGTLSTAKK